jgi:hypothetical protein
MANFARLRADINIIEAASANADIVERFPANSLVEILEDHGDWLKIKAVRIKKTPTGFIPKQGLIYLPTPRPQIFPTILLDEGTRSISTVAPNVLLQDFLAWMNTDALPAWLSEADWVQLSDNERELTVHAIKDSVNNQEWQSWLESVNANNRQNEAVMEEWMVLQSGGREVFTVRDHYIYKQPGQNQSYWGSALKGQMMRWTGEIRKARINGIERNLYRVDFYRINRAMSGWFRGDLTAEYFYPTEDNDPEIEANRANIFNLEQPILRHPQDPEFAAARAAGYTGAQYIDIRNALDKALRHYCLCGEICTAALVGEDVIPLLRRWRASGYWRVDTILNDPKQGTGVHDLKSILRMYDRLFTDYNSAPVPAQFVKNRLLSGEFAISGCGINRSGVVKKDGNIRHWVVVEDVYPVSNSGWVRIYNPFQNQEEVYEYNMFLESAGTGAGLWVRP